LYKLCSERRRQIVRDKPAGFGVARALSMPSVYNVTVMAKTSSAHGLAKTQISRQDEGEM